MPRKAAEPKTELDELLDTTTAEAVPAPKPADKPEPRPTEEEKGDNSIQVDGTIELTPEQKELARLRAELEEEENRERTHPTRNGAPLPEAELTPEQKEIRILQDRLAAKRAANISKASDNYEDQGDVKTIHFVRDGFTAQGRVWYTGQTVRFGVTAYEQTKDKYGDSWLDLTESEQYAKYGKVYFREGVWAGAVYDDAVTAEDSRRGYAAPVFKI